MQLTSRQDFPASPQAVHAMVTDQAFLEHAAQRMGASRWDVQSSPAATRVEATVDAPAEVSRFVGAALTIVQQMAWGDAEADGSRTGTVAIDVQGVPASLRGTARLEPTASGSTITYDGDFSVNVPLLGSTIERQAAPFIQDAIDNQGRVGREWLAR